MASSEQKFFLPTNICNNLDYIQRNQKNFERNFVRNDNLEGTKVFSKQLHLSSRPQSSGPCSRKPSPNECSQNLGKFSQTLNYCSDYSKVINQESDLYRLYNYDTKCPKLRMKLKYLDNPSSLPNTELNLGSHQPVVGIINPYCNLKHNSVFQVHPSFNKNVVQRCSDSQRLPLCDFQNYLQGTNAAAAQTDVRDNMSGKSCYPYEKNTWNKYRQISNTSSNIQSRLIKNEIINYQYPQSNPFMLEDIRVLKKPDSNIQPCENLFNNMSRRKCLVHHN